MVLDTGIIPIPIFRFHLLNKVLSYSRVSVYIQKKQLVFNLLSVFVISVVIPVQ